MSAEVRVLGYLRTMGPEQLWDVPWAFVAAELGVSARTVSRAVKDLEAAGLASVTWGRNPGLVPGGRNAVTVYDADTGEAIYPKAPAERPACAQCGTDEDGDPVECGGGLQDTAA